MTPDLSVPKAMAGPGKPGPATPEHLFAAGYAACFGGALVYVAKQHKKNAASAKVPCAVRIGPRDGGGFGLAVKLRVEDRGLPQADLESLAKERTTRSAPTRTPRAGTSPWILRSRVGEAASLDMALVDCGVRNAHSTALRKDAAMDQDGQACTARAATRRNSFSVAPLAA